MKVTVNFGAVRVIVPCGKGDLPVKQLMDLAITRYKKATGKSLDSWVTIHNLKLLSDGGILDPDDKLNDVADDREQITAIFDEEISPYLMHNGGDGTSASSIGTESPDIFQTDNFLSTELTKTSYNGSDVEITEDKITSGLLPLHVRRGSEPALNQLPPSLLQNADNCKRWSAAVLATSDNYKQLNSEGEEQSEDDIPPGEREDGSGEEKSLSLQNYIASWTHETLLNSELRREPLGGPVSLKYSTSETDDSDSSSSLPKKKIEIMRIKNEDGPLGIRIVPAEDSPERNEGVIIEGIEPGGRIDRDGRFTVGDRITAINGLKLGKNSYRNAHELLKDAMKAPELSIHCIKKDSTILKDCNKNFKNNLAVSKPGTPIKDKKNDNEDIEKCKSLPLPMPILTPKKISTALLHKGTPVHSSIRKVGRRILVHLTKGSEGLGFSITSKDPNNGPPFFIKNILPAGAAVDDGRLKTGDKLIEVNKVDVSNMTQAEVLNILRKVPFNDVVELVISRQETDLSPSPSLPRQLPQEKCEDEPELSSSKKKDIFTFEVPLNDTGSAGLGVSVKGKTSNTPTGAVDMGIFIKNIFHGGAAHKDGRLCNNDQLLNVNGIPLLGMTNGQAMETLRRAMIQSEGPTVVSNAIILTVSRRVSSRHADNRSDQGDSSCHDRSDSLLSESGDSFYVSNENLSASTKCNGQTPDTSTSDHSSNTVIHISPIKNSNECSETPVNNSRDYLSGSYNSVLERLTADRDLETQCTNKNSRLNSPVQFKRNCDTVQEDELLNLSSVQEHSRHLIDFEGSVETECYSPSINHKKSLSSPIKSDSSQKPYFEKQLNSFINTDTQQLSREFNDNFIHSKKNHFNRSGFGRQSMPEKMFSPSYQRNNNYPSPKNSPKNGHKARESFRNLHATESQNLYGKHPVIREMPVDVGPCESYVKFIPKHPLRSHKGSCDSPDCPYHAVPTRRESGSSEETNCNQVGPALGLFKSSSLESLQTMVQEQQKQVLNSSVANNIASRGCNESFRAAVDKSFEAIDNAEGSNHQGILNCNINSSRNHTRAKTVDVLIEQGKKNEKTKKKGLFRGLGSMFRFGKSSKKHNKETSVSAAKEFEQKNVEKPCVRPSCTIEEQSQTHCKEIATDSQFNRSQHQQSRPLKRHLSARPSFTFPRIGATSPVHSQNEFQTSPHSRQERMSVLRSEHQRRHKQRHGFYPHDNQDEMHEQQLMHTVDGKTMMNRPLPPLPGQQGQAEKSKVTNMEMSPKSKSLEIYKEMSKPGSRKGFVDPIRYSHYMNFQEIQQHLQQFRFHQNLFSSEQSPDLSNYLSEQKQRLGSSKRMHRHTVSSPRSRPLSEFIDVNSAEAFKHVLRGMSESGSLPRRMFPSSKQRLPIPSAFMFQQNHNQPMANGYASSNYNQDMIDFYKNGESSKV